MVQLVNGFYTTLQTLVLFSLKPLLIVKKKQNWTYKLNVTCYHYCFYLIIKIIHDILPLITLN